MESLPACDSWLRSFGGWAPQEQDLKQIFEPFGPVDFVTMQKDAAGRSLGQAYVQCARSAPALSPP